MIRSIFIWAFFGVINTLIWALFGIFLSLFSPGGRIVHFYCAVPWSKTILWANGVRVEIHGLNKIDKDKAYIYIPNHLSFFDIFALLACLPVDFKFIFKEEIMRVPILGWAMRKADYISISRSSPAKARRSVKQAVDMVKNGASLVIFAEGTRSEDGHLQPLKRGAFQLALSSGSPIVPVAIKGSNRVMPKGAFKLKKGFITIQLGRPIPTVNYEKKTMPELIERVTGCLRTMLEEEGQGVK
ncbi:MAG: 1-acyl-sn-glycerol-3-phosphate acyltransferase [Desulfobacterales bacterium]|nr:1-acyl-sn-glycerol-3-phosphate acyltransferase [Desulfobacterales bacterium]